MTAIILAGHGSHISPNTAGIVWEYVDKLRQLGIADEVTACFWKEQPHFEQVLATIASTEIIVVPLFTAAGYFSQEIIPEAMGLTGAVTKQDGRTIHYTPPLGEHPSMASVVQQRIDDVLQEAHLTPENTDIAVIGHGTRRNPNTRRTTQAQVDALGDTGWRTYAAFLDDEPSIPSLYSRSDAPHLIVVPYFLAEGSHVMIDVPEALGLTYGDYPASINGRTVYYTPPIGTADSILNIITQLVQEIVPINPQPASHAWANFPQVGQDLFANMMTILGHLNLGELQITTTSVMPRSSNMRYEFDNPSDLRQHIRENPFRSLATRRDLPADWRVFVDSPEQLAAVVETVYPTAIADLFRADEAPTDQLNLSADKKALAGYATAVVCGRCIRLPKWSQHKHIAHTKLIPCFSPCNHWHTTIKEQTTNDR